MSGDIGDRAAAREEELREDALRDFRARQQTAPTPAICIDCGCEIPPARRAVIKTLRCADCQAWIEEIEQRSRKRAA